MGLGHHNAIPNPNLFFPSRSRTPLSSPLRPYASTSTNPSTENPLLGCEVSGFSLVDPGSRYPQHLASRVLCGRDSAAPCRRGAALPQPRRTPFLEPGRFECPVQESGTRSLPRRAQRKWASGVALGPVCASPARTRSASCGWCR